MNQRCLKPPRSLPSEDHQELPTHLRTDAKLRAATHCLVDVGRCNVVSWMHVNRCRDNTLLHKLVWYRLVNEISDRQWGDILGVFKVQGTLPSASPLQ